MTTAIASLETQHTDMIHDAQLDYYAKRLATCSSDSTIKLFEVASDSKSYLTDLQGHEGPVWQIAWAHPKFGSIIASCGYDRKVIIWKEHDTIKNQWQKLNVYTGHELSVNSVAWAPHEYGLRLACASSDGHVSILTLNPDGSWSTEKFPTHKLGVTAVSWAPASTLNSTTNLDQPRFVTSGCDNKVCIWVADATNSTKWNLETTLEGHTDWVRDVQWAPNIGLPSNTIASAGQDGVVLIWTQDLKEPTGVWTKRALEPHFNETVWRVSWSLTGNILAVSSGDNRVTIWKESLDHQWKQISTQDQPTH